ncbi:MAG: methylmalonyl Co-A mutase-associated GTPase MeaB, partial [Persicimonas sp.]
IQATKAGILEIADVFVINKSDKPGSDRLRRELKTMLSLAVDLPEDAWQPPVVHTVATSGEGVDELFDKIEDHRDWLDGHDSIAGRDRRRLEHLVRLIVTGELAARLEGVLDAPTWQRTLEALLERRESPYAAADAVIDLISTDE